MINSILFYIRQRSILFICYSIALVLLFSASILPTQAQSLEVTAPTIIGPSFDQQVTYQKPVITGLSYNDTLVDVYIDGVYNGRAKSKNSPSGIASWSYTPFTKLSYGEHKVFAVARSYDESKRSFESQTHVFTIIRPYPAPILKDILQNSENFSQPKITGLALNDATVEVFIDGSFDGDILVQNDPSGTANFAYEVSKELTPGWHSVSIRAKDVAGKTSSFTKEMVFEVQSTNGVSVKNAPNLTGKDSTKLTSPAAPTLLYPKTGTVTSKTQPPIAGVVHNNLSVEVFIDNILNGEVTPKAHESGTTSFTYTPYVPLTPGVHTVFTRSVDERGIKSSRSNTVTLLVRPSGAYFVVSPQGVTRVYTGNVTPAVKGAQKSTTASSIKSEDVQEPSDSSKPDEPVVSKSSEPETTIVISESPKQPIIDKTPEFINDDTIVVDDTPQKTDVVVIDTNSTSTTTTTKNKNTSVIIALAIAAIIIIGLISWFTTSKNIEDIDDEDNEDDSLNENQQEIPLELEESDTTYEPVWEIEPEPLPEDVNKEPSSDKSDKDDDFVPPPPPPLNI